MMQKAKRMLRPTLLMIAVLLLAPVAALAQSQLSWSMLPKGFNPSTCEADREPPANLSEEELKSWQSSSRTLHTYSCTQLRIAYQWEPLQQTILDAANRIPHPGSDFNNPETATNLKAALSTLSASAQRVGNDFVRPETEPRDLIGDWFNQSQAAFAERGWEVPQSPASVFQTLIDMISKPYVEPLEQQAVLLVSSDRAMSLFRLSQEATRSLVNNQSQTDAIAYREAKKAEQARLADAGYVENVKARSRSYPGILSTLFGAFFVSGLGILLGRRFIPPGRSKLAIFLGGAAAYFLASTLAGVLQVITGMPTWAAWTLMLVAFGVIYVALRDKLQERFGGFGSAGTHGSATWAKLADAIGTSRLFERGMVSADSYGFAMGRFPNAPANIDPRLRYMGHVVTCAPTGSGKGIGAVIPTLLEYPGSALVLDIKGENYAVTSRARRNMGHEVYLIDPFQVTGNAGAGFNPLDVLDLNSPDAVGQVSALVETLVVTGASQDDSSAHFNDSAKDLIKGVIVYVKNMKDPSRQTLAEMRRILSLPLQAEGDTESIARHLGVMQSDPSLAHGIPARSANGFLSKESREASGVLSTALRHTSFLDDPRIATALSKSDFSFADLKRKPMTVYVVMPPDRLAAQVRFMRALVGSALAAITASSERPPYNVLFLLDEFAQLGRMQAIEDAISLVRGYGARFWLLVQDLSQLKEVYPKWQTFLANSAKQFFGTADYETAKYVSDMLGQATIEYRTVGDSSTTSLQGGGGSGQSSSQQLTGRSLLTPDEVMRYGSHRPIVLIQGELPYSLERLNYLHDTEYEGLADTNPFHG